MSVRTTVRIVSALSLVALASGCDLKVDEAELKTSVTKLFKEKLSLDVTGLSCPKDLTLKEGSTIECEVAVSGGKVPIVIKPDGKGQIDWNTKHDVIQNSKIEAESAEKVGAKVDCGKEVRLAVAGTKFQCAVADGRKVDVTVGADGKWNATVPAGAAAPAAEAAAPAASAAPEAASPKDDDADEGDE